jgi:hypothetical protein
MTAEDSKIEAVARRGHSERQRLANANSIRH